MTSHDDQITLLFVSALSLFTVIGCGDGTDNNPVPTPTNTTISTTETAAATVWKTLFKPSEVEQFSDITIRNSPNGFTLLSWVVDDRSTTNKSASIKATLYDPRRGEWSKVSDVFKINNLTGEPNVTITGQSIDNQGNAIILITIGKIIAPKVEYSLGFYRYNTSTDTWVELENPLPPAELPGKTSDGPPLKPDNSERGVLYYTFTSVPSTNFRVFYLDNDFSWSTLPSPDFQSIAKRVDPPLCETCVGVWLLRWTTDAQGRLWLLYTAVQPGSREIGVFVMRYDSLGWDTPFPIHLADNDSTVRHAHYTERIDINESGDSIIGWQQNVVENQNLIPRFVYAEFTNTAGWKMGSSPISYERNNPLWDVVKFSNGDTVAVHNDLSLWRKSATSDAWAKLDFPLAKLGISSLKASNRIYAISSSLFGDIKISTMSGQSWTTANPLTNPPNNSLNPSWVAFGNTLLCIATDSGDIKWASWDVR